MNQDSQPAVIPDPADTTKPEVTGRADKQARSAKADAGRASEALSLAGERKFGAHRRVMNRLQQEGLIVVLIILVIVMKVSSPYFFTKANLLVAASVVSILGIIAVTETLVIVGGEIDISIGSVMACTSVIIGLLVSHGVNIWLATVIGLVFSAAVGAINGIITVYFKINSLVTTLGTYSIFLGIAYVYSNAMTVSIGGQGFQYLGSGDVLSIPVVVLVFLGIWLIGFYVSHYTAVGRHIYATGDNYEAAQRSGVGPNRIRLGLFIANSLSAGVAGVIVTSQLASAAPQIGDPYLLSVITACILGGASMKGGRGTLYGTLIAVAILGVMQNGFALLQFSSYLENIVLGILLILAVLADQFAQRTR